MSARCPETGMACSTAYNRRHCRCTTCVAWNAERSDQHRRRHGARVQLRKLPGTVWCPLTGKVAVTAYKVGCRCDTCREANRRAHKGYRTQKYLEQRHPAPPKLGKYTDAELTARYCPGWAEFEEALRADTEITIRIARAAAEAAERFNSRNSVSA